MAKLALVGLLVLGHGACGLLMLRIERGEPAGVRAGRGGDAHLMLLWLPASPGWCCASRGG
jgi:hypothetical protein